MTALFQQDFAALPETFYSALAPTPVADARRVAVNTDLSDALGLDRDWLESDAATAIFAGNAVPEGARPIAQLYGGHQFGHWSGQLGDGRAILLGELRDRDGVLRDIQLKGSGRTPYSRGGDGRAWLGPVLREYLVSEAMHAMGVPTTRALAAVTTGETVLRETPLPGAVLTRVAASHIRVGTFQIHAARQDVEALRQLTDYTLARHYPQAEGPPGLIDAVVAAQARLVANWMGLGFIHGVMNTDNMALSGETIDYGPCAFMDDYDPAKVFSSIDRGGRYAYANQPGIALWNIAQLATALVPAMPDPDAAVEDFTRRINRFSDLYQQAWVEVFGAKLGLDGPSLEDADLMQGLLTAMAGAQLDFTATFTRLTMGETPEPLTDWAEGWHSRRAADWQERMARANPTVIPRNHRVEEMIAAATDGDFAPFHRMLAVVTRPYDPLDDPLDDTRARYALPPEPSEVVRQTFCGT